MEKQQRTSVASTDLLDSSAVPAGGVCVGTLVGAEPEGGLRVVYPGADGWDPLPARATVTVSPVDVGRQVVLAFEQGDPRRPIVLGVLQPNPVREEPESASEERTAEVPKDVDRRIRVDGRTVYIEADRELVLQCGKSSIILRAGGEVYVKGLKIVSRARETNKIKGGNVLIN
jgi:hypothetical protein